LPSEYIKRQIFATFLEDPVAPVAIKLFGEDNYLWGSDFPHTDSTWPKSRETIEHVFAGVPQEIADKILYRNAAKVYGLEL
jgi:predicted TIM-barrel fold metal-dependent hydrolase